VDRARTTIACVALAACFLPPAARANIGPKWWGVRAGEPTGLEAIAITREDLDIDLRPLAEPGPASVLVSYRLHNQGPPARLELVFVSGATLAGDFVVRLGDRTPPGHAVRVPAAELPRSWLLPRTARGFGQKEVELPPHRDPPDAALVTFFVEVPAGESTLTASYRAWAGGADEGHPTATWLFPYVLAPARQWRSFGELHVTVRLLAGWQSACTPELEREGDVLRGSFSGLPADVLVVTARAQVGQSYHRAWLAGGGLYALAVLGGVLLCRIAGRMTRRAGWSWWAATAVALAAALAWAAAILAACGWGVREVFIALGEQRSPYFHERIGLLGWGSLLLGLAALPVGFLLARPGRRQG
jgi:hypothetical protein